MNLEAALVQLVRLGLKGDSQSVARFVRRLVRDLAPDPSVAASTKEALAALIVNQPSPTVRFVDQSSGASTDAAGIISVESDPAGDEPVLAASVTNEVDALVREHQRAADLEAAGLVPTRTVLLTGPPGVGKTLTARSLARRLGVPLYRVALSALMSSFLGKTGQNLRNALAEARSVPSVLLLDEFDAIAKRRDDPTDVGELKRIVNVLLMELEAWPASSLLVAATNHPELLDRAIWRRFEKVIAIELPTADARRTLLARQLARLRRVAGEQAVNAVVAATEGKSGSDIAVLANAGVRRAVLMGESIDVVLRDEALRRLRALADTDSAARLLYCQVSVADVGMTQRQVAEELGISHVMVGKLLRRAGTSRPGRSRVTKAEYHA